MISTDPKDYPEPPPLIEQVRLLELRCEKLEEALRSSLTVLGGDKMTKRALIEAIEKATAALEKGKQ